MRKSQPSGPRRNIDLEKFKFPHPGWYTLHDCFCDYTRERIIAKGKSTAQPAWTSFNEFFEIVPPIQEVTTLQTGQIEEFVDYRVDSGKTVTTVQKDLTFVKAAIFYAHRRNRIQKTPYIELPDGIGIRRRPLTEEEYRLVMRQPMSARLRRFYRLAYYTGHRSVALEEATWDRTDLVKGTINFNVPGRAITNKRRNDKFPIADDFLVRLEQWKATARDEYVIGDGASTYYEANHVVRELAGLTDPTLVPRHCLRKTFVTALFEAGEDPEVVGDLVKDDPSMLRKHYVSFKHDTMLAAANLRTRVR